MKLDQEKIRQWDKEIYWHGFTQMEEYEPIIFERAEGCMLYDINGNGFLDAVSSLWCNVHGHNHPKINAAIHEQLRRVAHVTSLGASNTSTIELAKRLSEITPDGLEHVFFSDDGTTAVEVALKMAFQYWQQCASPKPEKTMFAALTGAYHGDSLGAVSIGGVKKFHEIFRPLLFEVVRIDSPDLYRLPENVQVEQALEFYLQKVDYVLKENHQRLAALIIEPLMQGAAGMVIHPEGFLRGVRQLTKQYDILLIADEVAVGFGRTGSMFACEQEDVSPDLLCLAKGITGGYLPLAATLTTNEIYDAFLGKYEEKKTFFHGHTYGGNPLGAAAGLASLEVFEVEQTLKNLPSKIDRLKEHLNRISNHPNVGNVRQKGLMAGVELVENREHKTPFPWFQKRGDLVCHYAMTEGVWLRPLGDVVVIIPPLAISIGELDRICEAVERGIEHATRVDYSVNTELTASRTVAN